MKSLITGASGQLGRDLAHACAVAGDDVAALSRGQLDITDPSAVNEAITSWRPDVVFSCAAWTAVDDCESDPRRAHDTNGVAVASLARASEAVGAHLVQVSTDYVFDGTKTAPYTEQDATNPLSVYGRSKLEGEIAAAAVGATVVRTSWVYSTHGGNMVETILRLADSHDRLTFVSDQRGQPTFTKDLADALRDLAVERVNGIVHVTNQGPVSWFEFAQHIFDQAGLDPSRVAPIATADLLPKRPAPRPSNSVLANDRFHDLGFTPRRHYRETLSEVVAAYR